MGPLNGCRKHDPVGSQRRRFAASLLRWVPCSSESVLGKVMLLTPYILINPSLIIGGGGPLAASTAIWAPRHLSQPCSLRIWLAGASDIRSERLRFYSKLPRPRCTPRIHGCMRTLFFDFPPPPKRIVFSKRWALAAKATHTTLRIFA